MNRKERVEIVVEVDGEEVSRVPGIGALWAVIKANDTSEQGILRGSTLPHELFVAACALSGSVYSSTKELCKINEKYHKE